MRIKFKKNRTVRIDLTEEEALQLGATLPSDMAKSPAWQNLWWSLPSRSGPLNIRLENGTTKHVDLSEKDPARVVLNGFRGPEKVTPEDRKLALARLAKRAENGQFDHILNEHKEHHE
jgi:hypothetical protein